MTTIVRRPLSARQPEPTKLEKLLPSFPMTRSPCFATPTAKRPRSPDPDDVNLSKRCKNVSQPTVWKPKIAPSFNAYDARDPGDKQRQKEQRQLANQEFVAKYTKAFPTFVFFFDERDGGRQQMEKIESVLSRLTNSSAKSRVEGQSAPLTQLLEKERLNGTTERDPKEKRHDYQYFSKGSHFFLVEDIRGEVAPIAIMEYAPLSKFDRTPTYPVLYMDPRARSPFTKYDEKEARKQEKLDANEKLKDAEKARRYTKVKELLKNCDREFRVADRLRRRASMSNVGQYVRSHNEVHAAVDNLGSGQANSTATYRKDDDQVASGICPSTMGLGNGYLAASGNSVIITSTTTTSIARNVNPVRLPTNLREQLGRQVIMNRRLENPNKAQPCLKKSKSTTTMRLPAREETKKPGYCEACRSKFDDFTTHLKSSRHRRFARNDNNYTELDVLLERLERKTMTEVEILTSRANESSITFPEKEHQTAEPSDGCLGPGDYFYTPLTENSENIGGKEGVSDCREEAEVEVEVDDEESYIILDDD
ncbi:hypothetical protein Clacol_000265 [Clathrus columnatus]|uniref:DBF4-type domain-containing protein n=1 Tax=Clathrus columnatus TaxID=1419009 RepID=A0AAV4ZWC8_9AGAM|nr:hypothetical protein Clacol_000265 [Clathrus columnatus]